MELLIPHHYEHHVLRRPYAQWPDSVLRAFEHLNRMHPPKSDIPFHPIRKTPSSWTGGEEERLMQDIKVDGKIAEQRLLKDGGDFEEFAETCAAEG